MSVIFQDAFTRANSTTAIGSPTIGGPYTVVVGTWGINNNSVYTSASTASAKVTFPGSYDFDAEFQVTTQPGTASMGLMFRYVDANNFWMVYVGSGSLFLWRNVAGVGTNIANLGAVLATDTFRVVGKGTYIYVYINGVRLFKIEDQYSTTASTMGYWSSSTTAGRIDNVTVDDTPPADMTNGVHNGTSTLLDESLANGSNPVAAANALEDVTLASDSTVETSWLYKGRDLRADDLVNIP